MLLGNCFHGYMCRLLPHSTKFLVLNQTQAVSCRVCMFWLSLNAFSPDAPGASSHIKRHVCKLLNSAVTTNYCLLKRQVKLENIKAALCRSTSAIPIATILRKTMLDSNYKNIVEKASELSDPSSSGHTSNSNPWKPQLATHKTQMNQYTAADTTDRPPRSQVLPKVDPPEMISKMCGQFNSFCHVS